MTTIFIAILSLRPPPSMRMAVKPHQAFFLAAQTDSAAGLVPILTGVPAVYPSILPRLPLTPG
jgi:hypothetical protein